MRGYNHITLVGNVEKIETEVKKENPYVEQVIKEMVILFITLTLCLLQIEIGSK